MSIQKLHYENISGILVRREGLLSWRCPLCTAEGQSLEVMRTCPECGSKEAALSGAQPAPSVPREAIEKMLTQLMDIAVSNGANSISMPDEYVEVAAWLCGIPAQPAPSFADAYQGAMEEVAIWKKRALEAEDLNRKFVAEINGPTYMGEPAQPAPSAPDGWKEGVEAAARLIDQKAELYAIRFGHDDMGMLSFGTGARAEIKMDHYTSLLELADEVRAMLAAAPEAKP